MSVPKELIWQEIRSECLDAIPMGSRVDPVRPINLSEWQRAGCYQVLGSTKDKFSLLTSSIDFGSALLTDSELLLDHATEHQLEVWNQLKSPEWISPAWLGVTVYYWSFFSVMAFSRLTNQTAWFLSRQITQDFKQLVPAKASRSPGAGCFRVELGPMQNATERIITLQRTDTRIHEEVWRILFRSCNDKLMRVASKSSSLEGRLYNAIVASSKQLKEDWPSVFRNAINYRSGFAYTAVRRKVVLKKLCYIGAHEPHSIEEVIDEFENRLAKLTRPDMILEYPQIAFELLAYLTFLIYALATDLHTELLSRHSLDRRWKNSRLRFMRNHRLVTDDYAWPLLT